MCPSRKCPDFRDSIETSELGKWEMSCLLTLGAHVQRGLQYLVCVSVSSNLPSQAITRPTRDTNSISATWGVK